MSDRPATEPRTEAGRRLAEADAQALWSPAEVRAAILAIEAEAAQGAAPLRLLERFAPIMADHPLWVERRVCNAPGCGDEDYFDHIRAIERGYPMNDFSGDDLDRAIAIVEDSRQTHVNWAEWRRKGNGTDTDHEMIGDLEWHENAIRDYDHVLSVLRAAPRAEGLPSVEALTAALAYADRTDDDPSRWYSGEVGYMDYEDHARAVLVGLSVYKDRQDGGNRPRAEGLDVERLGQVIYEMGVDDLDLPDAQKLAAHIAARLSRPSDERVPESEEPR